jgi:hypothetical protein
MRVRVGAVVLLACGAGLFMWAFSIYLVTR